MKKSRDSSRKNINKQQSVPVKKSSKSQLSGILLLKESEHYEQLLTKIHNDLLVCKQQLQTPTELPNDEILLNLIHIM